MSEHTTPEVSFGFTADWFRQASKKAKAMGRIESAQLWDDGLAHLLHIKAQRDDLLAALKLALPFLEQEAVISGYGYYRPANPHDFHPDHESCTAEEIANHKAACEAYDAGNYRDDYGDGWIAPNVHVTKAPWGIGSYTDDIPELKAQAEFCRAAIAKAEAGKVGDEG